MTTTSLQMSRQLLVGELIRRAAHKIPNQEAFIFGNKRITYRELEKKTLLLAGWLQNQGLKIGEKVGIIFKNNLEFVEVMFGSSLAGGISVPINFRLSSEEYVYIINHSDTKILFIEEEYQDMIRSIRHQLPNVESVVVVGNINSTDVIPYETIYQTTNSYSTIDNLVDEDDACMICYTSGTTGKPKGAVLTHKNLLLSALNSVVDSKIETGSNN